MNYHYTWEFGRHFDFIVGWLHRVNFFNFYFYVPLITVVAIVLFSVVLIKVRKTGQLADQSRTARFLWYSVHFLCSWIAVGAFAVAIKMLIVEELDYQERKWFESYLTPGHLYISSAAFAYLALILKPKWSYFNMVLAVYLQVALIAGYGVATYRVLNEDIEGALGGVVMLLFFAVCNYDLFRRVRSQLRVSMPVQEEAVSN